MISIIVPVYQNELNLANTFGKLVKLRETFAKKDCEVELIFVEDGSTDNSYLRLKDHFHIEKLTIVRLTRNFGQIPAIQAGLSYVSGEYIGIISADLQDPPELFVEMYESLLDGHKLVVAERVEREESKAKKFTSKIYWGMIKRYSMKDFPAGGFDFCMFDKQVSHELVKISEKNTNIFPLIFWLGFKPKVIPYERKRRESGTSTWSFLKKVKLTIDTVIGFTYLPTRVISIGAISTSIIAFIYAAYVFLCWFFEIGNAPDGWTTITLLILIIGGGVLFSLGILGEYLLRILDEVRNRPNFVVDVVEKSGDHQ